MVMAELTVGFLEVHTPPARDVPLLFERVEKSHGTRGPFHERRKKVRDGSLGFPRRDDGQSRVTSSISSEIPASESPNAR